MRVRKLAKPCPCCKADIADFLRTAQENREMADVIARLQRAARDARVSAGMDDSGEAEDVQQVALSGLKFLGRLTACRCFHSPLLVAWTHVCT